MSKSDLSDYSRLNLGDDADAIATKIRKAKTDTEPLPENMAGFAGRAEALNLVTLFAAIQDSTVDNVLANYGGGTFSQFKAALVEIAVSKIAPVGVEMQRLMQEPDYIDSVLNEGADRARVIADSTLKAVKSIIGFI